MTEKEKRLKVYNKCAGHCCYCGKELTLKDMQVDHMVPQYKKIDPLHFGVTVDIDAIENLWPTCRRCNHYKRGSDLELFRKSMLTLHERIEKHYINKVGIDFGMINIKPFNGVFYFELMPNERNDERSVATKMPNDIKLVSKLNLNESI